jgi:hypothetical protein
MAGTAGEAGRGRWGTMLALSGAAVFLSVLDVLPLVVLPLALLLMALPSEQRWKWMALGILFWVVGMLLPGPPLAAFSRGWALLLGGAFLFATLWRPTWGAFPRMLFALGVAFAVSGAGLLATGSWAEVDWTMQEHFRTVSSLTAGDLQARLPDSAWVAEFRTATERMAEIQWRFFPAMLGLQSLAALGLVSWWAARLRGTPADPLQLRPLKEFRFSDQLVWVLIAGLVLVLLPLGAVATRAGLNALLFMAGLYALRGVGVFLFLAGAAPSALFVVLAVLAVVFLYPLVLTAVLLVGLGDTWLDVRRRATPAPRA